ncbi:MAG: methyltransferase domain-containing protein [Myxococcaceae bacterium]|nr:methyltransferase domain-containing protein [Myxococcaceae bacterium]
MSFKDHFSGHAQAYAEFRPTYPRELIDALADASPATKAAWDVGCGSGQLSLLLTQRFHEVVATDPSAEQLARAPVAPRVTWRQASAEQSGLAAESIDCVVAAQAAHWFDVAAFVRECRRVGRPRALVALVTYGLMFVRPDLDRRINRFALETLAPYWPPERRHVDAGYATLDFPLEPVSLPAVTMRARWSLAQVLGYVGTWSAVAAARRAGEGARFDTFIAELSANWGAEDEVRTVEWPLTIRAGRV